MPLIDVYATAGTFPPLTSGPATSLVTAARAEIAKLQA
jgi:hypothetical protein